jgi:hypothetical protein
MAVNPKSNIRLERFDFKARQHNNVGGFRLMRW